MKLATLMVVAMVLAGLVGCSTGQSGVKNRFGTITATLPASPQEVTDAATQTIKAMDLILISSDATGVDGRVIARTARDDSVTIDVKATEEGGSNIDIRIGTFGNEAMSLTILDRIRQRLE